MVLLAAVSFSVVFISACCSLAEAVLYSVPQTHIEKLAEAKSTNGLILQRLRNQVDRPITAILTLNTVANTTGAAIAGALATNALGENNLVVFSVALTVSILLFSEILPKTFGVVYSRALAPMIARPLSWLVVLLTPVISLISLVTKLINNTEQSSFSQEELLSLTRMGRRQGGLQEEEAAVIENILALKSTIAHQIMTPRTVVFALNAQMPLREAADEPGLMVYSRIPVYDGKVDNIIGMVFRRDVLAMEPDAPDKHVGDILRATEFVGEQEPVDKVLELLISTQRHQLMVLDEFGGFAGVVTLEDVMEEILGQEIVDEFDVVDNMRELALSRRQAALQRMSAHTIGSSS